MFAEFTDFGVVFQNVSGKHIVMSRLSFRRRGFVAVDPPFTYIPLSRFSQRAILPRSD